MNHLLLALCLLSLGCTYVSADTDKVVCYYGSWASYRNGNGKCEATDLDPFICTHLIYSFAGLSTDNKIVSLDPEIDLVGGRGNIKKFNDLRLLNPALKTLIAIGGWNEGSDKYSVMASTAANRKTFINSVIQFLQTHGFNGLDMDWEYPANRGGSQADKENFVTLLKELRAEFDKYGYLLTAAVAAGKYIIDTAYKVAYLTQYLDFVNVMTYDFHGSWETFTSHHAPLYPRPSDTGDNLILNVNFTMSYYIDQGASPSKLNVGLPGYAVTYTLANPNSNGLFAPALYPGLPGPYTQQSGFLGYNEICEKMRTQPWTVARDPYYQAPYAYYGNQWAAYDDPTAFKAKAQFAKSLGLGGVMIWSIETEDFRGVCGPKYPLLSAAREALSGTSSTTVAPTTTTTTTPTTTTTKSTTTTTKSTTTTPTTTTTTSPTTTTTTKSTTTAPATTTTTSPTTTTTKSTTTAPTTTTTTSPTTTTTKSTTTAPATTTTTTPTTTTQGTTAASEQSLETYLQEQCAAHPDTYNFIRHPTDCQIFYQCIKDTGFCRCFKFNCVSGTYFDSEAQVCEWKEKVKGCN